MIKGEYKKPFVDDVIDLGAALKLSPKDLFEEANLVVESTAAAQESSKISNENEKLLAEVEQLKSTIEHLKELLTAKEDLILVYKKLTKDM
jgi:hypothetical protein